MCLPAGQQAWMWVKRLQRVVAAINERVTWLTGQKTFDAIKKQTVYAQRRTAPYRRPVGAAEKTLPVEIHYLLSPGELEGGTQ